MKILRYFIPLILFAASAFGQVMMTQAPGTYTDTSIPVRSGSYNKFIDAPFLKFTTSTTPGAPNNLLTIGSQVNDTGLILQGSTTAGNTANLFQFTLYDGSLAQSAGYSMTYDLGLARWSTSYWSTLSSAYVESFHFDPATNVTTFTNGASAPQFTSTVSTGTAPFVVASTTLVSNLHAATADTSTTTTNATNGSTVSTITNASFFPLFAASSTNSNQPFNLGTGLTFNPSTNNLSTTTFTGSLSGNATTSTTATNATNVGITNDTTTNASMFPLWATANTGNLPAKVTSTKLTFNPSTGVLSSTSFTGAGTGLTGTAASLTAGNVTTNANLTGAVTSAGNATSLGSFTSANLSSALTDETGSGVAVFGTSPAITTSLTTPSTTFALLNTTATTVNAFGGASTALNIGNASGSTAMLGVIGFDGATPSSSTAAIFPAGTTGVSSFRVPHGAAPTSPVNGDFWSTASGFFGRVSGSTVGPFGANGISGLTTSAIVTASSATAIQTPSTTATMDSSGNISTPGTLTVGNAATNAGAIALTQGTANSTGTTNITIEAPTAVTSHKYILPGTVGTNGAFWTQTTSGTAATLLNTKAVPTGVVVGDTDTQTLTNKTLTTAALGSSTATTQSASDNSTKVATTAYADRAARVQTASVNLGNLTGTINIDWSAGTTFRGVLTGNTTFTFSNGTDGQTIIVDVAQTGTNTFTVTWPSMKWPGGTAPTMTTGAATSDITTIVDFNAVFKGNSVQNVK